MFIEHLHSPFGVQLIGDSIYVANTDAILKISLFAGRDGNQGGRRRVRRSSGHGQSSLDESAARESRWHEALRRRRIEQQHHRERPRSRVSPRQCARSRCRDARQPHLRIGIRNPTGLGWEPVSGKLWAIANERDEIGADLVPDYLTSVKEGAFYGWPYSYYGQHADARVYPQRPDMVAKAIAPDYALGSHVAVLGLLFSTSNSLPEKISERRIRRRARKLGSLAAQRLCRRACRVQGRHARRSAGNARERFLFRRRERLFGAPVGLAQDRDGALPDRRRRRQYSVARVETLGVLAALARASR